MPDHDIVDYGCNLKGGAMDFHDNCYKMKYFRKDSPRAGKGNLTSGFGWPFIDIFYFKEDKSNVWCHRDKTPPGFNKRVSKSNFYPLIRSPFGSLNVHSPYNKLYYLTSR